MSTQLEIELLSQYADRFRRIWVQRTRYNSVCITIFPIGFGTYNIITRFKVSTAINYDYCKNLIDHEYGL